MAKKKRQPPKKGSRSKAGKAPKRSRRPPSEIEAGTGLPDRRALEGILKNLLGGLGDPDLGPVDDSPLSRAQEVMYEAFDEPDPAERARLAQRALEISPDCADAHVLLAEQAPSRKEALAHFEAAVAAGERALGPEAFRDDVGHFWGLLETRPYMRAREGLAHTLWTLGRREEAAEHLRELLRLNPNDNQGVRYTLAAWLLNLGRDDELAELLARFDEDSATWSYTRALHAFRRSGDTPEARKLLKAAKKVNKYVPPYLMGDRPMPMTMPDYYSPGEESEALIYAADHLSAWKSTPGAVTWLRAVLKPRTSKKEPAPIGPSELARARLRKLPQTTDVWEADCRTIASLVEAGGAIVEPWMGLVASRVQNPILAQSISTEPPTPESLWDLLASAMLEPLVGRPHRPRAIHAPGGPPWDDLRPHLEEIGVPCPATADLPLIGALLDDLTAHLNRDEPPGLLDVPGMTPEHVGRFYQAAADFYRKAPWTRLGFEEAIRVACPQFEGGPWYAVVMGQSGLTIGVALYEDLKLLRRLWSGRLSDEQSARETVALSVTFDPEADLAPAELRAIRSERWEIAGPEAYPSPFRKEKGMVMRPPLPWELELLEAVLRAVPDFIDQRRPGDRTTYKAKVPVASGQVELALSWVEDA